MAGPQANWQSLWRKPWQRWQDFVQARSPRERVILLAAVAAVIGYLWLTLLQEPMQREADRLERRLDTVAGRIAEQEASLRELQSSYQDDPDAYARERENDLRKEIEAVDTRLEELYGQLIEPRQMSAVLTDILQRETSLTLTGLENLPPETLFQERVNPAPLNGAASGAQATGGGDMLRVYKHGLVMEFEGAYFDTVSFLESLQSLETTFFWEDLRYQVEEYPRASIRLQIFTLSTEQGWLGV